MWSTVPSLVARSSLTRIFTRKSQHRLARLDIFGGAAARNLLLDFVADPLVQLRPALAVVEEGRREREREKVDGEAADSGAAADGAL